MSWFTSIKEMLPMSVQKQMRRTNEFSPANSPALVRYYDPKKGPKYPEELTHLPFRTRPTNEDEYWEMGSAHKNICYEEIDSMEARNSLEKVYPSGKWYIIHPLSRRIIRHLLSSEDLYTLKAWFVEKNIYKGTDLQSQMFLEARKETIQRVEKEVFRRGINPPPSLLMSNFTLLPGPWDHAGLEDEDADWVML